MEHAGRAVRVANGISTVSRPGELEGVGLVLGTFGEWRKLGETHHQPRSNVHPGRRAQSQMLVDPVDGQRREIVEPELHGTLVLAPKVVCLLQIARGEYAKPRVSEVSGNLHRTGAGRECLVQLPELRVHVREHGADSTPS